MTMQSLNLKKSDGIYVVRNKVKMSILQTGQLNFGFHKMRKIIN